MDSNLWKTALA